MPHTTTTTTTTNGHTQTFLSPTPKISFTHPLRILIIGAGSRGTAYAEGTLEATNCIIAAVAEPIPYKRAVFGERFIWGDQQHDPKPASQELEAAKKRQQEGQAFAGWREWVTYETQRREKEKRGEEEVEPGVDAVFVCVLDEQHEEVLCGIAHLNLHVCCEKPLSTSLERCVNIYRALSHRADVGGPTEEKEGEKENGEKEGKGKGGRNKVFGVCHVLRYSPFNMLLRQLVRGEEEVVGDVLSMEHVEPVGWWHFSHSYVRGNWRKERTAAPSLLTKSCHDIDFLLWMLCSPASHATGAAATPHLPSSITSSGSRRFFRKERKPKAAGNATNCLSCPHEQDCTYSAKKIYKERHLDQGNTDWPVKIVNPEIEEIYKTLGKDAATKQLLSDLAEDYDENTPVSEVEKRTWYGRCVYEADNDVCDDQDVTITWDDDPLPQRNADGTMTKSVEGRGAKTAQFHMVAFTEKICHRRGRIYGTRGEIEYDSDTIKVYDFATGRTTVHTPHVEARGHGGGDTGLARQFLRAAHAVERDGVDVAQAQREFLGCDLEEAFRSHAAVFAAEEARTGRKVVEWKEWWEGEVESRLSSSS